MAKKPTKTNLTPGASGYTAQPLQKIKDFLKVSSAEFGGRSASEISKILRADRIKKTFTGNLTLRDALFIALDAKGLKIPVDTKRDEDILFLEKLFPTKRGIPKLGGSKQKIKESPAPSSSISHWSSLVNKIARKDLNVTHPTLEQIHTVLDRPFLDFLYTGLIADYDMPEAKGAFSALEQALFYIKKQDSQKNTLVREGMLDEWYLDKRISDHLDPRRPGTSLRLYPDDEYMEDVKEGVNPQNRIGLGLKDTMNYSAKIHTPILSKAIANGIKAIQPNSTIEGQTKTLEQMLPTTKGASVTIQDIKSALIYNTLIPHRPLQVLSLRMRPPENLDVATDAYLTEDARQIIMADEGQKQTKKYPPVRIPSLLRQMFLSLRDKHQERIYVFRDNGVGENTLRSLLNASIKVKNGVEDQTKKLHTDNVIISPIKSMKWFRKASAVIFQSSNPNENSLLSNVMGHKDGDEKDVTRDAYTGRGSVEKTDFEALEKVVQDFATNVGVTKVKDTLATGFGLTYTDSSGIEVPYIEIKGLDKRITESAGAEEAEQDIENVEKIKLEQKKFEKDIQNVEEFASSTKQYIIENFNASGYAGYRKRFSSAVKKSQNGFDVDEIINTSIQAILHPDKKPDEDTLDVLKFLAPQELKKAEEKPSPVPFDKTPNLIEPGNYFKTYTSDDFSGVSPETPEPTRKSVQAYFDQRKVIQSVIDEYSIKPFEYDDDDDDDDMSFIPTVTDIRTLLKGAKVGKQIFDEVIDEVSRQRKQQNYPVDEEPQKTDEKKDKKRTGKTKKWLNKIFPNVLKRTPGLGLFIPSVSMAEGTISEPPARYPDFSPSDMQRNLEQELQTSFDIVDATPDQTGLDALTNLEKTYQERVNRSQPAMSTGIMQDSGITELDPRTVPEEQLDKIQAAKKDLQQQAAELFNLPT